MKYPLIILILLLSLNSYSQSNYIFSVPPEYNIHAELSGFSYTKPKTWQLKFTNIPEGQYAITITVSKPNTAYKQTITRTLEVDNGFEKTYFVIPYRDEIEVQLAVAYTLKELNGTVENTGNGRYTTYQNKPVFSKGDIEDLRKRAVEISFDNKMLEFLKSTIVNGWLYTEDVITLLRAFSFDRYRLDMAKFAFSYTIDKHKYYTLSNSFDFQSYYNNLMEYVKGK
jgi:hypothetical protein